MLRGQRRVIVVFIGRGGGVVRGVGGWCSLDIDICNDVKTDGEERMD